MSNSRSIICQVVDYRRFKTREDFKLLALKVVAVTCERRPLTSGSRHGDLTGKNFWYFGKLVAEQR